MIGLERDGAVWVLRMRAGEKLDRHCHEVGRDPVSVLRSVQLIVGADDPGAVRQVVARVIDAGFGHVVLAVRAPAPDNVARWLASEIIGPLRARS